MERSIRKSIIIGSICLAFLVLSGLGVISYGNLTRLAETSEWIKHSYHVQENVEQLLVSFHQQETKPDNYTVTSQEHQQILQMHQAEQEFLQQELTTTVAAMQQIKAVLFVGGGVAFLLLIGVYPLLLEYLEKPTLEQVAERERLIMASAQRIRETLDLESILETTVREVRQFLDVDRVLIYRILPDGTGRTISESVVPGYPEILGQTFAAEVFPSEFHQLYYQGRIRMIVDVTQDDVAPCLVDFLKQFGVKSKLVVAILNQGELWGLLIAHHCCQPRQWQPLEIDLLNQLSIQVTIAIQQAELYQQLQTELTERQEAQAALRQAHDQLERRVIERTAELTQINASLQTEIRDRLLAETAQRETEARNQALLNAIPDLIFRLDKNGKFWDFRDDYRDFLMISETITNTNINQLKLPKHLIQAFMQATQKALDTGQLQTLDYALSFPDYLNHYEARIVKITHEEVVVIVRNVTARKQAEEVRRALEREQELRQLQLHFFSMASHEFRTPLSTILASAQVLKYYTQEWSVEKRYRVIERIEATTKTMTQMLEDILTINRAEIGKLECQPSPIQLELFCHSIVEEMQLIAGSKYKINFVNKRYFETVNLDQKLLRCMLTNLLSNAIKYSPQGGEITLDLICKDKFVEFTIEDQGIGIPLEDQKRLFEVFHRGTNIGNIPGVGLGLTVVKKCLDLQNGSLCFKSEVGVGTTFVLSIPLR